MKKSMVMLVVGLSILTGIYASVALAQEKSESKKDWSRLKVVTYAGLTGFFDPDTGKLYVYDANMENCVVIRQMVKPGESMVKIKN